MQGGGLARKYALMALNSGVKLWTGAWSRWLHSHLLSTSHLSVGRWRNRLLRFWWRVGDAFTTKLCLNVDAWSTSITSILMLLSSEPTLF